MTFSIFSALVTMQFCCCINFQMSRGPRLRAHRDHGQRCSSFTNINANARPKPTPHSPPVTASGVSLPRVLRAGAACEKKSGRKACCAASRTSKHAKACGATGEVHVERTAHFDFDCIALILMEDRRKIVLICCCWRQRVRAHEIVQENACLRK